MLLAPGAWGAGPDVAPEDPQGWAVVQQEVLPALGARLQGAEARIEAREAFFAGRAPLAQAFPRLERAALGSNPILRGRLALLDDAAIARAREQAAPEPPGLSKAQAAAWRDARDEALRAEARADELERRLLVSLLAVLEDHPELSDDALATLRAIPEAERRAAVAEAAAAGDDEARRNAERRAAEADAELQRLAALAADLRLTAATGRRAPDVSGDLERLDQPAQAAGAADRLLLALPFLGADTAAKVEEKLGAWLTGPPLASARTELEAAKAAAGSADVPTEELDLLQVEIAAATQRVQAEEAKLARLSEGEGLAEKRRALALVLVEAARAELEAAQHRHRMKAEHGGTTSAELEHAKSQAQIAQEQADAARASAADARDRRRADALADYAAAQARSAEIWESAQAAVQRVETEDAKLVDDIANLRRQVEDVRELSALDPDRPDPNQVYRDLRRVLSVLRDSTALRGDRVLEADATAQATTEAVARDRQRLAEATELLSAQVLDEWAEVLEAETRGAEAWAETTREERDALLSALSEARVAKRELAPYISRELRQEDRSYFIKDMWQEVRLLLPSVVLMVRGRMQDVWDLPHTLTDWNVLRGLLASSFWAILSGLLWSGARNRADSWALAAAERVRRVRTELRLSDVRALRDPMARAIRNGLDLLLGPLLLWSLGETLPELQLVVSVYLYLALYRALMAVFDLAVVPTTEVRPALMVLLPETKELARTTVQAFLGYLVLSRFLEFVLWDVLGLDTLSSIARSVLSLVFWGLIAWTLYRWEPTLRHRLARRPLDDSRAVAWLIREDGIELLRIPRAAGQIVFFGAVVALELSHRLAREGTSLAWLFNVVSRYRLKEEDDHKAQPLPEEDRARIAEGITADKHLVEREELGLVDVALAQWQKTGLRGLVAVVGDRGMGKRTACDRLQKRLGSSGLTVVRAEVPGPIRTRERLFEWLANVAGCPEVPATPEAMVEAIEQGPKRAFLLEGIHRCFARKVGGVEVVQTLLYVLNASSDHNFYVVSVHGPAWDYFDSLGSLVDCGVFHTVVKLAPLTSQQLRELTLGRAGQAAYRVDFSGLQRQSALGGDPETEKERSISVFYRLLAEASGGSPTIAVDLFSRCLEATEDKHLCKLTMNQALSMGVVAQLTDPALFVLVALNLHDALGDEELVEITNLSMAVVRATVRDLVSRGLVRREGDVVRIPNRHRPAIQRTLRRRHFLHLGA